MVGESDEQTAHHSLTCWVLALHDEHTTAGMRARKGRLTEMRPEKAGGPGRTEDRSVRRQLTGGQEQR